MSNCLVGYSQSKDIHIGVNVRVALQGDPASHPRPTPKPTSDKPVEDGWMYEQTAWMDEFSHKNLIWKWKIENVLNLV